MDPAPAKPPTAPTPPFRKGSVSVIIPCYKQAQFLATAIDSVLSQTYRGAHVIVVNDGSPDDTASVARRYGDRIIYLERPNGGLSAARNTGLDAATGEFVQFLDADDFLMPDMHANSISAHGKLPPIAATYCSFARVDEEGKHLADFPAAPETSDEFHRLLEGNPWPCHTVVVRRSALPPAPVFDEKLRSCEDWDLWLRIALHGGRFRRVDALGASYRTHAASMSKNGLVMYQTALQVVRRHARTHRCPLCAAPRARVEASMWNSYVPAALDMRLENRQLLAWLRACATCMRLDPAAFRIYAREWRHRKRWIMRALVPKRFCR